MIKFLSTILCLIFVSCASVTPDATPADEIRPAREDVKKQFTSLKKQIVSSEGETKKAYINELHELKKQERGTEIEPEIDWFSAQEDLKNQRFESAGLNFLKAARGSKSLTRRYEACQQAALAYEKAANIEKSVKGLNYCVNLKNWDKDQPSKLLLLQSEIYVRNGDKVSGLQSLVSFMETSPLGNQAEVVRNRALMMIQDSFSASELKTIGSSDSFGFLRGHAWFRYANTMADQRNNSEAIEGYRNVIGLLPATDLAEQSQQSINQIDALRKVSPTTVGAVLPLSGKNAQVGERVLRGIQLGLGLNGQNPTPFKLAVVDDENNPDAARRAVGRLVREDNVIAIVGSVSSKTAAAVASEAQSLGVPSIALSQKAGVTDIGPLVFRNALTSDLQVRYLVRSAMKNLGIKRFAIMYPNDKFGVEYANIFWDEVLARGGEVRAAQVYEPNENNFKDPIQRLIGTFYLEDRAEEYKTELKNWTDAQANKTARTEVPDDLVPPAVDFEALFIADSVKALGQIAPMLAYYNVRGLKILGPSIWNGDAVVKRTGGSFNRVLFVDSVQAQESDALRNNFVRDYKSLYGDLPGAFEVQGFDSALAIRQMLLEGATTREELSQRLQGSTKIDGILGDIKVWQRELSRPVSLLTVENNLVTPLTEAILKKDQDSKVR